MCRMIPYMALPQCISYLLIITVYPNSFLLYGTYVLRVLNRGKINRFIKVGANASIFTSS